MNIRLSTSRNLDKISSDHLVVVMQTGIYCPYCMSKFSLWLSVTPKTFRWLDRGISWPWAESAVPCVVVLCVHDFRPVPCGWPMTLTLMHCISYIWLPPFSLYWCKPGYPELYIFIHFILERRYSSVVLNRFWSQTLRGSYPSSSHQLHHLVYTKPLPHGLD